MANEKELMTRIQLKYDSLTNWTTNNPVLKSGEVAIAYLASSHTTPETNNGTHPVMFKVGPGNFNSLPWTSALAADVHAWAKKSEADFTAWVKDLVTVDDIDLTNYYNKSEIDGLISKNSTDDRKAAKDYVDTIIDGLDVTDTAVAGKYVSAVSETNGKISVTRADLPTYTLTTGSANGTVAFNGSDVAVKGLGSAAYTEAGAYATAAQGAKADSAVQDITIFGTKLTNGMSYTGAEAIATLGLKGAAFTEPSAYDVAGAAATAYGQATDYTDTLKTNITNGTVVAKKAENADNLGGTAAANYLLKSEAEAAYDPKGAAAAVLGKKSDEAGDETVMGALKAAAAAQADIDAFFASAETGAEALDTLKEIQDFLNSDDGTVQTLIDKVAANEGAIEDIIDGTTTVSKAMVADTANGLNAGAELQVKAIKVDNAAKADVASSLDAAGIAQVQGIKVNNAGHADSATTASNLDAEALAQVAGVKVDNATSADSAKSLADSAKAEVKAIKVDNATNADKLGNVAAANYLLKSDAPGYADILTKTAAQSAYQPKGDYASAAQGAKADSAVQSISVLGHTLTDGASVTVDQAKTALGLKSAAYVDVLSLATAAQGTKADSAVQKVTILGHELTNGGSVTVAQAKTDLGLKSAAYTESSAYATAAQGTKADSALQEIKTTANGGLKVTNKNQIDIDTNVVFVFNCGSSSTLVD